MGSSTAMQGQGGRDRPASPPGRPRASYLALLILMLTELLVSSGFALFPLKDQLLSLEHLRGWLSEYNFALSNLDIWVLGLVKVAVLLALLAAAPRPELAAHGSTGAVVHKRLRMAVSLFTSTLQTLLLAKAVGVAVFAPDSVWPQDPAPGQPLFVGLLCMFGCLFTCLFPSFVEAGLARYILKKQQTAYEAAAAAAEQSSSSSCSLRDPLLPTSVATTEEDGIPQPKAKDSLSLSDTNRPPMDMTKAIFQLLALALPDAHINCTAFLAGGVAALFSAMLPYYTGMVIDYASIEPDRAKFLSTILHLVCVSVLCGVFTGIRGGLFTLSMARFNVRLRKRLFHTLVQMEIGFFDKNKTGDISSRLASDTNTASDQITLCMNVTMRSVTSAVLVLVFMLAASWRLTTVTFILVPFVMAVSSAYGRFYATITKKVRTELADANAAAEEVLGSMGTVAAHAAQSSAEAAYCKKLDSYFSLNVTEAIAYSLYACLFTVLPSTVSAAVLFYGGSLVLLGKMSAGSLVSFMLYQQSLSGSFQQMSDVFSGLMAAVGAADKVLELMNRTPEVSMGGSLVPESLSGCIELRDVCFRYPTRPELPILKGLSLLVNPGEVIALVGPSGGGKSSIVKLVERFYLPESGQVLLDGRDIGVYNNKWLRRQVALVSQEPVLYARSIKRNIIFGLEPEDGEEAPPTQAEIEESCMQANAHDFITGFTEGYETNCGEKGAQMSGGQKQRIAIARALIRRPRVLLLDEATSALDADSEAVVQGALDRMMEGRTTLVIAHRLSTIQHADKIIVIAKGTVQEVGSHEELLARNGAYASLIRRQMTRSQSSAMALTSLT